MRVVPLLALVLAAAACTTSPERAATLSDRELCIALSGYIGANWPGKAAPKSEAALRSELERRRLIPPNEWKAVNEGKVGVGMSVCSLYAVMGAPTVENDLAVGDRLSTMHVYDNSRLYKSSWFYSKKGVITAWRH